MMKIKNLVLHDPDSCHPKNLFSSCQKNKKKTSRRTASFRVIFSIPTAPRPRDFLSTTASFIEHRRYLLPCNRRPLGAAATLFLHNQLYVIQNCLSKPPRPSSPHCRRPRRRRRRIPPSDDDGPSEDGDGLHHVWYIRNAGLDEATIESIAVVEYKAAGGLLGATDCSFCLGEFEDGDLVRLLPKCGHGFHVPCIDTWLRAHVNCPLCRAHIIDPPVELAGAAPPHPSAATTAGTISVDDSSLSAPVDNPETGIQAQENDIGVQDVEEEIREIENGTGVGILIDQLPESSELRVPSDLGEDGLQPVRRSVSMDLPFLAILPIGEELEENSAEEGKDPNFGEEQRSKYRRKQGNSSKRVSLKKSDSAIKRSLSSSGWGFSRYGRVAKNSIPPL